MDSRKQAIKNHLKPLSFPEYIKQRATAIGLKCSETITKLTKVCAGVGLYIALNSKDQNEDPFESIAFDLTNDSCYSLECISEMLGISQKQLYKHFSRMQRSDKIPECLKKNPGNSKDGAITKFKKYTRMMTSIETLLKEVDADDETKSRAYEIFEKKKFKSARLVVEAAYADQKSKFISNRGRFMNTDRKELMPSVETALGLRLENLIKQNKSKWDSLPVISQLDMEKAYLAKVLQIAFPSGCTIALK
ncbi:hypothetical protein SteCoe_21046 [Stentor coeruleus]|uniref:Uncharacterized protein n=1 Tax=Stentor coeruleus TaxID=5963 RepID=A0A1R2BQZ1_9CILI|nr:hypothetical protein SteCoe_21046 [Stentor coeruleus]